MKKLKFLKIFLISFAVFCTISIGAVSSYMFFANVTTTTTLTTWVDQADSSLKDTNKVYTITTPKQLAYIAKIVNGGNNLYGYTIKLANDINLSAHNWVPIGKDLENPFQGTFDGQGHTISGLNISGSCEYAGLFGCVSGEKTIIKNVVLSKPTVTISGVEGTGDLHVGSVAGYLNNESKIENVIVDTPKITAYHAVKDKTICAGGAVGYMQNSSTVTRCYVMGSSESGFVKSSGTVMNGNIPSSLNLTMFFGGVVGKAYNYSTISVCYSNVTVDTTDEKLIGYSDIKQQNVKEARAGGIAGVLESSTIDQCYNTGDITSSSAGYSYSGGICGYQTGGEITNCFNTKAITSNKYSGGIVAYSSDANIQSCYNTGDITSNMYSGGICAYLISSDSSYNPSNDLETPTASVNNCYNKGEIAVNSDKIENVSVCYKKMTLTKNGNSKNVPIFESGGWKSVRRDSGGEVYIVYNDNNVITDFSITKLAAKADCSIPSCSSENAKSKGFNNFTYCPDDIIKSSYKPGASGGIVAYAENAEITSCKNYYKFKEEDYCFTYLKLTLGYLIIRGQSFVGTEIKAAPIFYNFEVKQVNTGDICGSWSNCGLDTNVAGQTKNSVNWSQCLCVSYHNNYICKNCVVLAHYFSSVNQGYNCEVAYNLDESLDLKKYENNTDMSLNNAPLKIISRTDFDYKMVKDITNPKYDQYLPFVNSYNTDTDTDTSLNAYFDLNFNKEKNQIELYARSVVFVNGSYSIGDPVCFETIDMTKFDIDLSANYGSKDSDSSDSEEDEVSEEDEDWKNYEYVYYSGVLFDSDYWDYDKNKVINGGMPYLKAFYW